jgi:hypothetical protein
MDSGMCDDVGFILSIPGGNTIQRSVKEDADFFT